MKGIECGFGSLSYIFMYWWNR